MSSEKKSKQKQAKSPNETTKPELFICLVGASGTDLSDVYSGISKELKSVGYDPQLIKLSDALDEFGNISIKPSLLDLKKLINTTEDARIKRLMDIGDTIRDEMSDNSAVAQLALSAIKQRRKDKGCEKEEICYGTAYILSSLKHPDEVTMLRDLYGKSFILISVYSPRKNRLEKLTEKIAKSHHRVKTISYKEIAAELIERDKKGNAGDHGQNVRDTFPLADVFITEDQTKKDLGRFFELLFGHPFITPNTDEYAMFHAQAAALRSSDLSRQVGAVITTDSAEIISTGCNEVPKAGGGKVWENTTEDKKDYRDFQVGNDANSLMKHELITEIFTKLNNHNLLDEKKSDEDIGKLAETVFSKGENGILRDTKISSIIEYGRIVHAEMSTIMEAARRGLSVNNSTLYCTTFPCHMCTRHIIDAGIRRVVYIEPYPKSMAKQLYNRSICVDGDDADEDAVQFEPFVGVAPRKYFELFQMPKRKDDHGYKLDWKPESSHLRFFERFPNYIDKEVIYINEFNNQAVKFNLIKANS